MSDRKQYMPCVELNDIMRALGLGIVRESKCSDYPEGTLVSNFGGVCDYFVGIPGANVFPLDEIETEVPLTAHLGLFSSIIGLTAWVGVRRILDVKPNDIVVISGASGAVGSVAGQLAKSIGAKVIGIAGGSAKCERITKEFGFDVAIDYKNQNVAEELAKAAPEGVTCYFENVGGPITETVMDQFQNNGRMAYCGSISEYNDQWDGVRNFNMILNRRLMVKGYICLDHMEDKPEAMAELAKLYSEGKMNYDVDVRKVGLEKYVESLNDLYCGKNKGKLMMQINEEK